MFNATVSLNGNGVEFRPGMSAIVELIVEAPEPKLVVSRAAIEKENGTFLARVRDGRRTRQVPVNGYVLNETDFVVDSGLNEGDRLVVPVPGEDS